MWGGYDVSHNSEAGWEEEAWGPEAPEDVTNDELKWILSAQEQGSESIIAMGTAQRALREARQQLATSRLRRGSYFPKGQCPGARPFGRYGTKGFTHKEKASRARAMARARLTS